MQALQPCFLSNHRNAATTHSPRLGRSCHTHLLQERAAERSNQHFHDRFIQKSGINVHASRGHMSKVVPKNISVGANEIMADSALRVGLCGIGLEAYWPQFDGLKERLEGYVRQVASRLKNRRWKLNLLD